MLPANASPIPARMSLFIIEPSMAPTIRKPCSCLILRRSSLCHAFAIEAVAKPTQCDDVARTIRTRLDLFSKVGDLVIDDSVRHMSLTAPNFVQQPFPGHQ